MLRVLFNKPAQPDDRFGRASNIKQRLCRVHDDVAVLRCQRTRCDPVAQCLLRFLQIVLQGEGDVEVAIDIGRIDADGIAPVLHSLQGPAGSSVGGGGIAVVSDTVGRQLHGPKQMGQGTLMFTCEVIRRPQVVVRLGIVLFQRQGLLPQCS